MGRIKQQMECMQMVSGFHSITVQGCCILVSGVCIREGTHTLF